MKVVHSLKLGSEVDTCKTSLDKVFMYDQEEARIPNLLKQNAATLAHVKYIKVARPFLEPTY